MLSALNGDEDARLKPCAYAEVKTKISKGRLRLINDQTPYYLDSYEETKEVPMAEFTHSGVATPPITSKANPPEWAKPIEKDVIMFLTAPYAHWHTTPTCQWYEFANFCVATCFQRSALIVKAPVGP